MEEKVKEFAGKLALVPIPPPGQLHLVCVCVCIIIDCIMHAHISVHVCKFIFTVSFDCDDR